MPFTTTVVQLLLIYRTCQRLPVSRAKKNKASLVVCLFPQERPSVHRSPTTSHAHPSRARTTPTSPPSPSSAQTQSPIQPFYSPIPHPHAHTTPLTHSPKADISFQPSAPPKQVTHMPHPVYTRPPPPHSLFSATHAHTARAPCTYWYISVPKMRAAFKQSILHAATHTHNHHPATSSKNTSPATKPRACPVTPKCPAGGEKKSDH